MSQQQQQLFPLAAATDNNTPEKVLCVLEAIHDFEARSDDELTLLRGELVEVIENDGKTPSAFLQNVRAYVHTPHRERLVPAARESLTKTMKG